MFKLTPPAAGQTRWTETVLHRFTSCFTGGTDGCFPDAGLIFDAHGALYGTTSSGAGTVFKLAPPAAGHTLWTETVLHSFTGGTDGYFPYAGLIFGARGALYGTTDGGGSSNFGTVFKLTPPAAGQTRWTETVLHSFTGGTDGANPQAGLIFGAHGALYGTTIGGGTGNSGTVFEVH